MPVTRFDMENQAIQRRIAIALERIAEALDRMTKETGKSESIDLSRRPNFDPRR